MVAANSPVVLLNSVVVTKFLDFVKIFVEKWNKQEEEQEKRQKESESLYKIR